MLKKTISTLLVILMLSALSVPVLASSSVSNEVMVKNDTLYDEIQSAVPHGIVWRTIQRNFANWNDIPPTLFHQEIIGGIWWSGLLTRIGAVRLPGGNGYRAAFAGEIVPGSLLPFEF